MLVKQFPVVWEHHSWFLIYFKLAEWEDEEKTWVAVRFIQQTNFRFQRPFWDKGNIGSLAPYCAAGPARNSSSYIAGESPSRPRRWVGIGKGYRKSGVPLPLIPSHVPSSLPCSSPHSSSYFLYLCYRRVKHQFLTIHTVWLNTKLWGHSSSEKILSWQEIARIRSMGSRAKPNGSNVHLVSPLKTQTREVVVGQINKWLHRL